MGDYEFNRMWIDAIHRDIPYLRHAEAMYWASEAAEDREVLLCARLYLESTLEGALRQLGGLGAVW